jgi:hypothetical protein
MKKLALILIVSVLCMSPFTASADDHGRTKFHGTYEMIASGSCVHSVEGWQDSSNPPNENFYVVTPPFLPIDPDQVYAGTTVTYGTWTFNKDGTGNYTLTNYATILPGSEIQPPKLLEQHPKGTFTFTVSRFGDITVTTGNEDIGFVELTGSISNDKKTMILISANQVQDFRSIGLFWTVCNTARTLIKVND